MDEQQRIQEIFAEFGKSQRQERVEQYKRLNQLAKKGQIVFTGSSLMEQFPINELLMDEDLHMTIYNRGIGGLTTEEMLPILDTLVYELEPSYVFINIGTNDLNGPEFDKEGLMGRYCQIIRNIQEKLPQAVVYMLAYYPVNGAVGEKHPFSSQVLQYRTNKRIAEANQEVEKLAGEMGVNYLDVNRGLYDESGNLKEEYTLEGMHMYATGYRVVLDELLPLLKKISGIER